MARNAIVIISFAVLAFVCLLQVSSTTFNLGEYLTDRIQETIKRENLDCSNYEKFCLKSNKEFQTSKDPKDVSANLMAIELCKVILKAHVCLEEELQEDNELQKAI